MIYYMKKNRENYNNRPANDYRCRENPPFKIEIATEKEKQHKKG